MSKLHLLIADDEEKTRRILEVNLQQTYELHLAENGGAALELLRKRPVDIVVTDLKMPDIDGAAVLREVRKLDRPVPVIIMTAFGTIENAVAMMKEGAFDYVVKPVNLDQLDLALTRAAQHARLARENERLRIQLQTLAGSSAIVTASARMQAILDSVQQIAGTTFTVLIEGETGTGKELIARAIHSASPRASQSFVAVNCGAIPRELLESEFFGNEKGAFTGATARRIGKFEQAHGGTLFLDEIGELPLDLQVKLLRALEDQVIVRVGGSEAIALDVRIVAATNRTLRAEVEAHRFRSDLYYRLNVVSVQLPPLRERTEDIPLLAQHFLVKHKNEIGKDLKGFEPNALTYMKSHRWPGNVRELENIVVRAMVGAGGDYVTIDDLPSDLHLTGSGESESLPTSYQAFLSAKKKLKDDYMRELERNFVLEGLRNNRWNVSHTARALGMDRRLLQNKMKELGLKAPELLSAG
ncbi:MAG: sigma-54 dependent transcriptional regulator [Bacteroidota bacterium]